MKQLRILYKPLGVIGLITPWNGPFVLVMNQAAQALHGGNTIVAKGSEVTPFSAKLAEEIFRQAGLPEGVLQVLLGDGETGAAIVRGGVDKVSFTGSVATGRKVAEACASQLIPCTLELGEYVPPDYIDEMHVMADGADLSFDDLAAANVEILIGHIVACSGISAWGNATVDGQLYRTRSFDQPLDISDPQTGTLVHDNAVLIIRNPENGYASIAPSFAGSMHGGGGFNEQGIAVGQQALWSKDYSFYGAPGQIRVQDVLDHAATAQEAIDILISNKDVAWNFIVSDRTGTGIAPSVAPDMDTLGVMLPYTPLHHLLLNQSDPILQREPVPPVLVMTSGNFSEEPIATDNIDAQERLAPLADAFLIHNRDIHIRCDDSVVRVDHWQNANGNKMQQTPVRYLRRCGHMLRTRCLCLLTWLLRWPWAVS